MVAGFVNYFHIGDFFFNFFSSIFCCRTVCWVLDTYGAKRSKFEMA